MKRHLTISPRQADLLRAKQAALEMIMRERDAVLATLLAADGLDTMTGYELTGTTLTVEVPDGAPAV